MSASPLTRLADARPEVSARPHTVTTPGERAALLRSITASAPTVAVDAYVDLDGPRGKVVDLAGRAPRRRRPLLLAAAGLVVVAAVGLGLAARDDGGTPEAPAAPPGTPVVPDPEPDVAGPLESSPLPAGFDPTTASAVFAADGDVDAVAQAYAEDRFDVARSVTVDPAVVSGATATATWSFGEGEAEGTIAQGQLFLREEPTGWVVTASLISEVLLDVAHTGARVTGTASTTNINSLAVDVLTADGQPVPGAPEVGMTDVDGDRFGTAGMTQGTASLDVDVPVDGPVVLRAWLVGGSVLGVAEVALNPPSAPMAGGSGEVTWSVEAQETLDGWCVGLASGEGRVCVAANEVEAWPPGVWYRQLGPTVRRGDHVLITGLVHPSVTNAQVRRADGTEVDGASSILTDERGVFLVYAIPFFDGPALVDLQDGSGTVVETVELEGLEPVGG
jgi:hypothetical protein